MKIFYIFCIATAITLAQGQGGIPAIPSDIFALLQTAVYTLEGRFEGLVGWASAVVKFDFCAATKNCSTLNLIVGPDTLMCYSYGENDTALATENTHVIAFDATLCVSGSPIPITCSDQTCSNVLTYFSSVEAIEVTVGLSPTNQVPVDDTDYIAVCSAAQYCFRYQDSALIDFSML